MSQATMTKQPQHFYVRDAAERYGVTTGRIRQICIEHGIGTVVHNQIRVLTKRDMDRLGKFFRKS